MRCNSLRSLTPYELRRFLVVRYIRGAHLFNLFDGICIKNENFVFDTYFNFYGWLCLTFGCI